MTKQIETLIEDIYALFTKDEKFDSTLFRQFGDNLHDIMETRFHSTRDPKGYLRMSSIGRPDRQIWLGINGTGEKESLPPATYIKFSYGDMLEQMALLYAKMSGHTVEREQEGVDVDGVPGHIDAIIDGVVVDVKSASSYSFQKFESGDIFTPGNDAFGYVGQLCGYMVGTGCERGGFLVVDKTLGKLCFCEIPPEVVAKYKVHERIAHLKTIVALPDIPPKCYDDVPDGKSGNMKLDTGCSYCQHKFGCWPGLKTFYYSGGPRYLTKVVRPPNVKDFPDREI